MRRLLLTTIAILLGYSTAMASGFSVGSFDRHVAAHHVLACGSPVSGVTWIPRQATQHFQRCIIVGKYRVLTPTAFAQTPTPRPTLRPSPTVIPTVVPLPTPWPTPIPSATPVPSNDPVQRALQLINDHRAEYGLRPLTLNATQSTNSTGHAQAMAATGFIWHVNPAYPQFSFPQNIVVPFSTAGENVGQAGSVDQVDALMWSEPHYAGCSGSHACNDITASYTSVGIGVYQSGGYTWYVADFVG